MNARPLVLLSLGLLAAMVKTQARLVASLGPEDGVTANHCVDLDGDGRAELVLVGGDGSVRVFGLDGEALRQRARLVLPDPDACLFAFADVDGKAGSEVVTAGPNGVLGFALRGDAFADPLSLVPRTRFRLRTGKPAPSSFVRDLNGDGRADLVIPGAQDNEVWLRQAGDAPAFVRALSLPSNAVIEHSGRGAGLHATLRSAVRIPPLDVVDLNGDGRLDLRLRAGSRFGFRLQGAGGAFADLKEVDLSLFRDTTPQATVTLGATAALSDNSALESRDLDGDGIPDYVVVHRRKVWVFLADKNGPQFENASEIKAVAEDVTATLLVDLDADARADLLLLRVQIPTAAQLALSLVRSLSIDVHALGYKNEGRAGASSFASAPAWRRTITLSVPPLLTLFEQQDDLAERLFAILDKVRFRARGAFTGKGARDLLRASDDGAMLEVWPGVGEVGEGAAQARAEKQLADILFRGDDTTFDLDRLFLLLDGYLAGERAATLRDARPLATLPVRPRGAFTLADLLAADLDGDGRDEAVAVYRDGKGGKVFDVLRY